MYLQYKVTIINSGSSFFVSTVLLEATYPTLTSAKFVAEELIGKGALDLLTPDRIIDAFRNDLDVSYGFTKTVGGLTVRIHVTNEQPKPARVYAGHATGSGVQNHSCGAHYPHVVFAQETSFGLRWGVISPKGNQVGWCASYGQAANEALKLKRADERKAIANHYQRQAEAA